MNYSQIKLLAQQYSDSDDAEVADNMDNFIIMTESRINLELDVRPMFARARLNLVGNEYYGLPEDFRTMRDIELSSDAAPNARYSLGYVSPEQMNFLRANSSRQKVYTIIANQLQIYPDPESDGTYVEIVYAQSLPPLSDKQEENWLSNYAPNAYVFGILVEISSFTKDENSLLVWNERFSDVMKSLIQEDASARWSGTPLTIRVG